MVLRFSIIIPIYNAESTIERCLDSLIRINYPKEAYEIILVENGSTDKTPEIIKRYPFRVVHESQKNSFSARNCGIKNSDGEIIVLTDADCVVTPGWLKAFDESFTDGKTMGCGGKIVSYHPSNIVEEYPSTTHAHDNESALGFKTKFLPWIDTANAAYRRDVFDEIGLFDDIQFQISGDVDMGWRASLHGFKLKYSEKALVYHINRSTLKDLIRQYSQYGQYSVWIRKKYQHYYSKTLGYNSKMSGWNVHYLFYPFLRAIHSIPKHFSIKGFILIAIDFIVALSALKGELKELKNPRLVITDRKALDEVAPKPLKKGFLVWGSGEGKYIFNFQTEMKHEINDFGLFILENLHKGLSMNQIVELACQEWDAEIETIRADIKQYITELQQEGFITEE